MLEEFWIIMLNVLIILALTMSGIETVKITLKSLNEFKVVYILKLLSALFYSLHPH